MIPDAAEHRSDAGRAERSARALEAALDIIDAIGGTQGLGQVLELIVERGRALVGSRSLLVMLRDGDELVVAAAAGLASGARGQRLPIHGSTSGEVLRHAQARRVTDVAREMRIRPDRFGVTGTHTALLVPMLHRGTAIGILVAFDRGGSPSEFGAEDEQLLRSFAQAAANAVTIKRSVDTDRLRAAITAADAERARWARELHDQTLQALGALRVLLATTAGRGDADSRDAAIRQATQDIDAEISNLREIIADLRPALLDDLGLLPAIEALIERRRDAGLQIRADLQIADIAGTLDPELETTVYRLIQEALGNVVKHAGATHVQIALRARAGELTIEVVDDGSGFDTDARPGGFGLIGMRERAHLAGGTLTLDSSGRGTALVARLPLEGERAAGDGTITSADTSAGGALRRPPDRA